ncbi:outer membrane beta-barrel protein [Flavobacterium sp.]|uniref:outer membrane beta-barrel protein n=1 Tax=Flavobacterium sp. TaxID=239 RepID=UPI0038FD0DF3
MKKVLLTAVAVFAFSFANAQDSSTSGSGFSKGNLFISGSVGVTSEKTGDVKSTGFNFSPKAGYFVSNNIAVGLALGVGSTKDDNGVNTIVKDNNFSVGAFGRYYFTPSSQFSVFGQLGFDVNSTKSTTDVTVGNVTTSTVSKANGFGVALAPGVSYFLSNHFAIEAAWGVLNFNSNKPDVAGADATTNVNFGLNLNDLNFGLVYKF